MARNQSNRPRNKPEVNERRNEPRKGDTRRTSSQGRKLASGGSTETNNQGRPKGRAAEGSDTIGNP